MHVYSLTLRNQHLWKYVYYQEMQGHLSVSACVPSASVTVYQQRIQE